MVKGILTLSPTLLGASAKLLGASCVGRATTVSEVDIGIDAGHTATRWLKALLG